MSLTAEKVIADLNMQLLNVRLLYLLGQQLLFSAVDDISVVSFCQKIIITVFFFVVETGLRCRGWIGLIR